RRQHHAQDSDPLRIRDVLQPDLLRSRSAGSVPRLHHQPKLWQPRYRRAAALLVIARHAADRGAESAESTVHTHAVRAYQSTLGERLLRASRTAHVLAAVQLRRAARVHARPDRRGVLGPAEWRA